MTAIQRQGIPRQLRPLREAPNGGRTWWAHFALTRINIAPTILPKKIEEVLEAHAHPSDPTCDRAVGKSIRSIDEEAANMTAVAIIRGAV